MTKDHFCGQFGIGIAQEKYIHCRFRQNCAWRLNLHAIPKSRHNSSRRANNHSQCFEVIDQAAPPAGGPIAGELWRSVPEYFIINTPVTLCIRESLESFL